MGNVDFIGKYQYCLWSNDFEQCGVSIYKTVLAT